MIRVTVDSIRVSLLTQHRVVVLRESDSRRYLPIWIGPFEADAIQLALEGTQPHRPMTHDLALRLIEPLGGTVQQIVINRIAEATFYAEITLAANGQTHIIDARPSDAIALAVRNGAPIYVEQHVLDQAGVPLDEDESVASEDPAPPDEPEKEPSEEGLTLFRDFINTLDLDDDNRRKDQQS